MIRRRLKRKPRRARPGDDPEYLAWLRTQPCAVCLILDKMAADFVMELGGRYAMKTRQFTPTEAAHIGLRGFGQKCPDRQAIPLCSFHHRTGPHSHHVLGKRFWSVHLLDRERTIQNYNERYDTERNQCLTPSNSPASS